MKEETLNKLAIILKKASSQVCSFDKSSNATDKNKTTGSPDTFSEKPTKSAEESTKMPVTEDGEVAVAMNNSSSNVSDDKPMPSPFAGVLELFKIGSMDFFMDFDGENETDLFTTNIDMKNVPDSYKLRFDTLCQIYSIHIDIVNIKIETIKKNIFLLEEDCNPDLAEPVGMLYDESDFCCCPESSMGGLKPVMTTSRGSKPFMTTMRSSMNPSMTTKKTSMGSSNGSDCKCSNELTMTTKGPSMKTTQRMNPAMAKSFKLRYRKF